MFIYLPSPTFPQDLGNTPLELFIHQWLVLRALDSEMEVSYEKVKLVDGGWQDYILVNEGFFVVICLLAFHRLLVLMI
jgi:hypothetical protein